MNNFRNHLSSFNGLAVQMGRDTVSNSFYAVTDTGPEHDLLEQVKRHNCKRFKRHAKAFRLQRITISM